MVTCRHCGHQCRPTAQFCSRCGLSLGNLPNGTKIGNYTVVAKIGGGGIGSVYLGRHQLIQQFAAIKVHDYFPTDEYVGRAFLQAANYLSQLDHPNIVQLYDYGFHQNGRYEHAYMSMEYVFGSTLAELIPSQQTKAWIE